MTEREIEHARKWLRDHPGQGQDSVQARIVAEEGREAERLREQETLLLVAFVVGASVGAAVAAIVAWVLW